MAFISVLLQMFWKKFYRNVSWVVLYQPYEFCPNRWFWLVAMAMERLYFQNKYSKIFFSEAIRGMKLKLCINVHDISLYINSIFIVVANGLSLLWQLTMGKVEIGIYFCVTADILTKVLLKCFWGSPLPTIWILPKSLILIGGHGSRKAKFSRETKNIQKQ